MNLSRLDKQANAERAIVKVSSKGFYSMLMKISPHFHRSEFACKCGCGYDTADIELVEMLEIIRGRYDVPVTVNSGCRCVEHNKSINGSENSQHLLGRAADILVQSVDPERVANFINRHAPNKFGVGIYDTWVHIDSRENPARWDKRL